MAGRRRYKFVGRITSLGGVDYYIWQARIPNDSRFEEIRCTVDWFWNVDD